MGLPRSVNVNDKIFFVNHYNSLKPKTKSNFEQIKNGVLNHLKNCDYGYTDRPDFRFAHKYVFCHIDLLKRPERLQIRLKYYHINSKVRREKLQLVSGHQILDTIEKIIDCYKFYIDSINN